MKNLKENTLYLGIFFLAFSLNSCSDDDDGPIDPPITDPTGTITASDQTLNGDTIVVQSVEAGQDSWLAAVHSSEEDSDNFIAGPLLIEEGTASDVSLLLNDDAVLEGGEDGNEIVLKLYAEDDDGILGEWDIDDELITVASETITIMVDDGTAGDFSSYDENADGTLDMNEFANTYQNDFAGWDADEDGSLNAEEFYNTTFDNTDANDDDTISEEEWNTGYTSMYGNYVEEDDFSTFDTDGDGTLNSDEWNQGFGETEVYGTYDNDENDLISETEWNEGLFGDWDANGDDLIDEDEFNTYSGYAAGW